MDQSQAVSSQQVSQQPGLLCRYFSCCPSWRTILKTLVLFYSFACATLLVWTSLARESLTNEQQKFSKAFTLSLFIATPVSMTLSVMLLYLDCNRPANLQNQMPIISRQSDSIQESGVQQSGEASTSNSTSFKTVLTINSGIPTIKEPLRKQTQEKQNQQVDDATPQPLVFGSPRKTEHKTPPSFVNFTPIGHKGITIVNIKKKQTR